MLNIVSHIKNMHATTYEELFQKKNMCHSSLSLGWKSAWNDKCSPQYIDIVKENKVFLNMLASEKIRRLF